MGLSLRIGWGIINDEFPTVHRLRQIWRDKIAKKPQATVTFLDKICLHHAPNRIDDEQNANPKEWLQQRFPFCGQFPHSGALR